MALIDLMDESYIGVERSRAACAVAGSSWWRIVWPELTLTVSEDRGDEGVRWVVAGALTGTAEVWLEDFRGRGTVVHYFLRTDPGRPLSPRRLARLRRDYTLRWKAHAFALKDALESAAAPSSSPPTPPRP
ncbi:MAG: hypothetical protein L0Y54_04230 [Sporichthyaceae bacterium]|nr:hypothetical protein [Sporichthyaceae bacterium]